MRERSKRTFIQVNVENGQCTSSEWIYFMSVMKKKEHFRTSNILEYSQLFIYPSEVAELLIHVEDIFFVSQPHCDFFSRRGTLL